MISGVSFGQNDNLFRIHEDTLKLLGIKILSGENDSVKFNANNMFQQKLHYILSLEGSYDYPFDSLVTVARIKPPDGTFKIFNWNLPKSDGTYNYFGILQTRDSLFVLTDSSDQITSPESALLSTENWYGSHYYKIIQKDHKSNVCYTLLGWDGNDNYSTKKIIEILTFDENSIPYFGKKIFVGYEEGSYSRIIFEYSSMSSMSLKYELQSYDQFIEKKKGIKIKEIQAEMIVFDHLVPMDQNLEGQYRFYVPVGDMFHGFVYDNGMWNFHSDVNAWNRNIENVPADTKPVEQDLLPPR